MLLLILACALIGAGAGLATWTVLIRRGAVATIDPFHDTSRRPPRESTTNLHDAMLDRSVRDRVLRPFLDRAASFFSRLTPDGLITNLHKHAIRAGLHQEWTRSRIAMWKGFLSIGGVVSAVFLWRLYRSFSGFVLAVCVAVMWYLMLDFWLKGKAKARQDRILMDLADVTDQISISVQAGLGFEAALQRTAASTEGPLSEELNRLLHDIRLGATRSNAFYAMAERVEVDDLTNFVRAMVLAERTGISISRVLEVQADELRERRRQRAEERAMRMPVMLVFPLVLFILPPLFIVLLGPAIMSIFQGGL